MTSPAEQLFERWCRSIGVPCSRVAAGPTRTPDFLINLRGTEVACEVKQLDPNADDLEELKVLRRRQSTARFVPNRLRGKLKDVSAQLQRFSRTGCPTLLVIYDNTPFKAYTDHGDVVQAMFGRITVRVGVSDDPMISPQVSAQFFAGDRGVGSHHNTSVSAVAILDGGPEEARRLRVYHNPYAAVRLEPLLLTPLPVSQPVLPDATEVSV